MANEALPPLDEAVLNDAESVTTEELAPITEGSELVNGQEVEAVSSDASPEDSAAIAVGALCAGISMVWPQVQYDDETQQEAINRLIPVFEKHGGGVPDWMAGLMPELKAVSFFALVGFNTWKEIKAAEVAAIESKNKKEGDTVGA